MDKLLFGIEWWGDSPENGCVEYFGKYCFFEIITPPSRYDGVIEEFNLIALPNDVFFKAIEYLQACINGTEKPKELHEFILKSKPNDWQYARGSIKGDLAPLTFLENTFVLWDNNL